MKGKSVLFIILFLIFAEIAAVILLGAYSPEQTLNAVSVNDAVMSVSRDWYTLETHTPAGGLDYCVIDLNGAMLYKTRDNLSESISAAVVHHDIILDAVVDDEIVGKIIIYNDEAEALEEYKARIAIIISAGFLIQFLLLAVYWIYIRSAVINPFGKLKSFAERVADGNLDIPLEMDRGNIFGAFTESFDIMRAELKKARLAELKANAAKKELVAKLSHDIKTPVASIKAASELGAALADTDRQRENYGRIVETADRINILVTNLLTASLEELTELPIVSADMSSAELKSMLELSDYMRRAVIPEIPECLICADKLRLQQVFDNIIANSYKYANTDIHVSAFLDERFLNIRTEDSGGGVNPDELPMLCEKFRRGENSAGVDGAGLGLYISDHFMREMSGRLIVENGRRGLAVTVRIPLCGK